MDDRVLRLRVGVVVLAAALITAFLVARFGDLPLPGGGDVHDLCPASPVLLASRRARRCAMSGVQIGRVTDVELLKPTRRARHHRDRSTTRTMLDTR